MNSWYKWDKKYLYYGITSFLVIAASIVFFVIATSWHGFMGVLTKLVAALAPVIYGLVFGYLLKSIMVFFEKTFLLKFGARIHPADAKKAKRLARSLSVTLTVGLAILVICGSLALLLPQLIVSVEGLANNMEGYFNTVVSWVQKYLDDNPQLEGYVVQLLGNVTENLEEWIRTRILAEASRILSSLTSGVFSVLRELFNMVVGIVISVYVLYHKEVFGAQAKKVMFSFFKRERANRLLRGFAFVDKTFGSYMSGKLIDSFLVFLVCYLVLVILKMPYAMLISFLVGVTNMIPFFGPFIGAIPAGIIILLEAPQKCLIFAIFITVLQQIEGNIIYPKIQGQTMGLSGFWVMFATLLFGGLFGFWGLVLGVPVFAVIYEAISSLVRRRLAVRNLPIATGGYIDVSGFDPETSVPIQTVQRETFGDKLMNKRKTGKKPADDNNTEDDK